MNISFHFRSAEWAVPQSSKLKYTQMFNAVDKTRSGFLTGTQARGILLQTNVPQNILARVWALSDRDSDGRLGCEEFVLALYLCEMFSTGKTIPTELPPELIPPSFRKIASRPSSIAGSRHGSVSSQGASAATASEIDAMAGMHAQCKNQMQLFIINFFNFLLYHFFQLRLRTSEKRIMTKVRRNLIGDERRWLNCKEKSKKSVNVKNARRLKREKRYAYFSSCIHLPIFILFFICIGPH